MVKPRIFSCVLLLLLLFVAATPMLTVKSAKATKVAVQWGHLVPSGYPPSEPAAESWISDQIYWDFYDYSSFGPSNAYGTYTTLNNVIDVLQYCQYYTSWATTWWVGDYLPSGAHYGFYGHNQYNIFDYYVFAYANYHYWGSPYFWWQYIGPSKQYFDFIWTCTNGGLYFDSNGDTWDVDGITAANTSETQPDYTPENPFTDYGYVISSPYPNVVGMPLAWTGTTDMSTDGYVSPSGSYCYIGWENISPFMINVTENAIQYKWFPYYFRYALGIDNNGEYATIADSLDYASLRTCGSQSFDLSELYEGRWRYGMDGWWYSRMRVFGNSDMILPD